MIDYGDGTCDVSYAPVSNDIGQEITIKVIALDPWHPVGCTWSLHELAVEVTGSPVTLDCGWWYKNGATNNLVSKSDISIVGEICTDPGFTIVSGPGEIDPETGFYSWMPGSSDMGLYEVMIDAPGTARNSCSFQVEIIDESCCPGDANFTSTVNVGDAVFLINYIFKGGAAPTVMNWADVNSDCQVNVGDVVFLIAYVFKSGPPPQLGCYYSK